MNNEITVWGMVATTPRHIERDGLPITSFRMVANNDKPGTLDYETNTNWFTVTLTGQLAVNAFASIKKAERVIVCGNLTIRDWDNGDAQGTWAEITATVIGHNLNWGTAEFTRVNPTSLTIAEAGK